MKNTADLSPDDPRSARQIIRAFRDAGWTGPISLTTFPCPDVEPKVNDFRMDYAAFVDTGGFILPQCYPADHPNYTATNCVAYSKRVGLDLKRLNLMLELASSRYGRVSGVDNAAMLGNAGWTGPQISVFQAQDARGDADWQPLETYARALGEEETDVDKQTYLQAWADYQAASLSKPVLAAEADAEAKWRAANPREAARYDSGDFDPKNYNTRFGKALAGFKKVAA